MTGSVNIGGVWKSVNAVSTNVGGTWKTVSAGYTNIGGTWKQWYASLSYWITRQYSPNIAYDETFGLAVDSLENVYYVGTVSTDGGSLTKLDKNGQHQFTVASSPTSGSGSNTHRRVAVDSSGNVYTVGRLSSINAGQVMTTKFNSSGSILWQRHLGAATTNVGDYGWSIAVDSSGNVYVGGTQQVPSSTSRYSYFIKYDTNGNLAWVYSMQVGSRYFYPRGVALDSVGDPHYVVHTNYQSSSNTYAAIQKISAGGVARWGWAYGTNLTPYNIAFATDGNIYIVGGTNGIGASGTSDAFLMKVSSAGDTVLWTRYFGSTSTAGSELAYAITVDNAGYVYIGGMTYTAGYKGFVAKFDSNGTIQWQRQFALGGTSNYVFDLKTNGTNSLYVLMYSSSNPIIAKFPLDGSKTGTYTIDGNPFTWEASSHNTVSISRTATNVGLSATIPGTTQGTSGVTAATVSGAATNVTI